MRYVIDASVAIRWLLEELRHENADFILRLVLEQPSIFAVPELFLYETFAVLHRFHPDANAAYHESIYPLIRSGVLRYPVTPGVYSRARRIIEMGLTGYDAIYVALAEELDAKWLTYDAKAHSKIVGEHRSVDLNVESVDELIS